MIKIEFEAANGADLRKEMLALLGMDTMVTTTIKGEDLQLDFSRVGENISEAQEPVKEVKVPRTRKAKEVETPTEPAIEETTKEETPAEEVKEEAPTESEGAVTAEDLTKKCVELGRAGKRDAVLAMFESKFDGATISKKDGKPQLQVEQYAEAMEALNAL